MLLLETKENNSHVCYFDSSNILGCKYKRDTKQLAVIFRSKGQYVYEGVTPYSFQRFKVADSQGKAFNRFIKNKFKFTKAVENMDLSGIYETIEELKKSKE